MSNHRSPTKKLLQLEKAVDALTVGYLSYCNNNENREKIAAADEIEPRIIYMLIRACPNMIHSVLQYIEDYTIRVIESHNYYFKMLFKCIYFIEHELNANKLKMDEGEFEEKVKKAISDAKDK